jgi:deoxyribodipyrimidine photolyase
MKSLVWLRADLRLEDNPALKEACLYKLMKKFKQYIFFQKSISFSQ